jgi:hypothetical protein
MRITFNPSVMNTSPIKPVQAVRRKKASLEPDPVETEASPPPAPVTTSVSELGLLLSREEPVEEKGYKKRDPLWNTMLNL